MPKINLPNIAGVASVPVTRASMETQIQQIEYLLEGRLDIDNIDSKDGSHALVSADTVQDIATTVRPIGGVKVFGTVDGETGVTESTFLTLINKMGTSPNLTVISKEEVVVFLRDDAEHDYRYPKAVSIVIGKSPDLRLYPRFPSTNRILTSESDYYNIRINAQVGGEESQGWHSGQVITSESAESVTLTFSVTVDASGGWNDGSEITMTLEAFVVCERLI